MATIHGNVGEPLSSPKYRSRATTAHDGLRVAYLGGALVELAGALIALVFIRDDSMEQRKRLKPARDQPIASRP